MNFWKNFALAVVGALLGFMSLDSALPFNEFAAAVMFMEGGRAAQRSMA